MRKNKISEKLSKIDWIAKIYGKLMFKICIIFKFSFKKMFPRMSFNLKKIIFGFFTLISWSENEIDFYFFTPFTHIWSHCAWHSGLIPEKSIPNPSLVFGLVGSVESVGYPFSIYKQLVNWISLWIFVKPILCSIW